MRNKIVAGNWKMNCNREEALILAAEVSGMLQDEQINGVKVIIAPPFVHLAGIGALLKETNIEIAAQNCSSEAKGAFTGEVSAEMIKSVGAQYVIIGHSERRQYFKETHAELAKKTNEALSEGLSPIFCVGESLEQRKSEMQHAVILNQIMDSLGHLTAVDFSKIVIAYEPVWAIGTGQTASAEQVQDMHFFIRQTIGSNFGIDLYEKISILYGGSCNENNAKELFSLADVDGGLIGGASLKSRSFVTIVKSF